MTGVIVTVGTENFDLLESSPSFSVGIAVVRDACKGVIEVSFMLRELRWDNGQGVEIVLC